MVAGMEPTPEECATFTTVSCIAKWANVKGDVLSQLYGATDMEESDHWRAIAGFSIGDWTAIINQLTMPKAAHNHRSTLGCRVVGLEWPLADNMWRLSKFTLQEMGACSRY